MLPLLSGPLSPTPLPCLGRFALITPGAIYHGMTRGKVQTRRLILATLPDPTLFKKGDCSREATPRLRMIRSILRMSCCSSCAPVRLSVLGPGQVGGKRWCPARQVRRSKRLCHPVEDVSGELEARALEGGPDRRPGPVATSRWTALIARPLDGSLRSEKETAAFRRRSPYRLHCLRKFFSQREALPPTPRCGRTFWGRRQRW